MPLYEYQCDRCGRFEIIQKFSDAALKVCPTCGGVVQKLLSAPAIQFKGTGWYVTDYARKSSGSSEGSAKGGESAPASSGTDSKDGGGAKKEASSKDTSSGGTSTK